MLNAKAERDLFPKARKSPHLCLQGSNMVHSSADRWMHNTLYVQPRKPDRKELEVTLTENERVRQFGFTATELEREKKDVTRNL